MPLYCVLCYSPQVDKIVEQNSIYYRCERCQNKSAFTLNLDGKMRFEIQDSKIKHFAAASILQDYTNKILLIRRRAYPFIFALPAGHLNFGETPLAAIKRKLLGDLGITLDEASPCGSSQAFNFRCRHGGRIHEYWIFHSQITVTPLIQGEKVGQVFWATKEELSQLNLMIPHRELINSYYSYSLSFRAIK